MKENAVILFTRIPVPGKTKTRLMPLLSAKECCHLHRAFLSDIYNTVGKADLDCSIYVCYHPDGDVNELIALLPGALSYTPQVGESLGDKMHNAICDVLNNGYKKCLLIGSDVPLLKGSTISEAFNILEDSDIVICPTEDGGYYLIGMKEPCPEVFRLDEFGVSSVLEKTIAAAHGAGKSCTLGTGTFDIDEPEDLKKLVIALESESPDICKETRKTLINFPF